MAGTDREGSPRSVRLGYGEFSAPAEHSIARWHARQAFLWRVEDVAPKVLEELQRQVLPVYDPPFDPSDLEELGPYEVIEREDLLSGVITEVEKEFDAPTAPKDREPNSGS